MKKAILTLSAGATAVQMIGLAVYPVLTRLYVPHDMGQFAVFSSIVALTAIVACLRYELAIPLPQSDDDARNLLTLCVAVSLLVALTVQAVVGLLVVVNESIWSSRSLNIVLWLVGPGVLAAGLFQSFTMWSTRAGTHGRFNVARLVHTVTSAAIQLVGSAYGAVALAGGLVVGQLVGSAVLTPRRVASSSGGRRSSIVSLRFMKLVAVRYARFPKFSTWGALANAASHQLPALVFAGRFGVASAAFYFLAQKVMSAPVTVIGPSVGRVLMGESRHVRTIEESRSRFEAVMSSLAEYSFVGFAVIAVCAPMVFGLVFGEGWSEAGNVAAIIAPWAAIKFVTSPLTVILAIQERQGTEFALQSTMVAAVGLALAISAAMPQFLAALAIVSAVATICYIFILSRLAAVAGWRASSAIRVLVRKLVWPAVVVSPYLGSQTGGGDWYSADVGLTAVVVLATFYYGTVALKFKRKSGQS